MFQLQLTVRQYYIYITQSCVQLLSGFLCIVVLIFHVFWFHFCSCSSVETKASVCSLHMLCSLWITDYSPPHILIN